MDARDAMIERRGAGSSDASSDGEEWQGLVVKVDVRTALDTCQIESPALVFEQRCSGCASWKTVKIRRFLTLIWTRSQMPLDIALNTEPRDQHDATNRRQ